MGKIITVSNYAARELEKLNLSQLDQLVEIWMVIKIFKTARICYSCSSSDCGAKIKDTCTRNFLIRAAKDINRIKKKNNERTIRACPPR